jgi:hypothetical protein
MLDVGDLEDVNNLVLILLGWLGMCVSKGVLGSVPESKLRYMLQVLIKFLH